MSKTAGAYNADYNRLVQKLLASGDREAAMRKAVGGEEGAGDLLMVHLDRHGLRDGHYLIDVGCGSGQLSRRAARLPALRYLGLDVVPELLAHAKETSGRPDFRFQHVDGLYIPEADDRADFVCFFSVVTHLLYEESLVYLAQARRVLKPGGLLLFSFLDVADPYARKLLLNMVRHVQDKTPIPHLNSFMSRADVPLWARMLGMEVVEVLPGGGALTAPEHLKPLLSGPVVDRTYHQALAVLRKPS
jgi:SAM-dependent methyltransferase